MGTDSHWFTGTTFMRLIGWPYRHVKEKSSVENKLRCLYSVVGVKWVGWVVHDGEHFVQWPPVSH